LAERRKLLRLDKAVLCGSQILQGGFHVFEQARVLDRDRGLRRKSLDQVNSILWESPGRAAADY